MYKICAMFGCGSWDTQILIGDDGKEIFLCPTHYKMAKKAQDSRFK